MSIINLFTTASNLTLKRQVGSISIVKGTVQAVSRGSVAFTGSVQPITGEELLNLPEGQRTKDPRTIYTETELKTVDKVAQTVADVVTYEGNDYVVVEVQSLDDWNAAGLAHYEVTIIRGD